MSAASAAGAAPLRARSSSAPATTVRAPSRSSSGSSWPGTRAALLDERVDGPQQVGGVQVGVADGVACRDRALRERRAGSGRSCRPSRSTRRAGRAGRRRARRAASTWSAAASPGRRDVVPEQLAVERAAGGQRPAGDGGERDDATTANARAAPRARRASRPRARPAAPPCSVVRRNWTGTKWLYVKFDARRSGVPSGKPADHDEQADQHERERERRVRVPARPREARQRQRGHEQPRDHDRQREQQHAAVAEVRPQLAAVADAEVGDPVAHQPQRLGQARRAPDRPGLLGEAQEVDAVARLHEQRHDPPRRDDGRSRAPSATPNAQTARQRHGARPALVEREQQRPEQHPRRHRRVHPAAGRRHDQRERRRPAPRRTGAQAAHGAHEQPRQRGVAEQRDRRAGREDDDVRVEQEQQRRRRRAATPRGRPASSSISRTAPHAASGEHQPEPQALHEPRRAAERVAEREERPHREQVAAVLAALDVAEVAGRRPRGGDVGQEAARVDVQVDLRVRRRPPGPLDEREPEGERRERRDEESVARRQGGEDTVTPFDAAMARAAGPARPRRARVREGRLLRRAAARRGRRGVRAGRRRRRRGTRAAPPRAAGTARARRPRGADGLDRGLARVGADRAASPPTTCSGSSSTSRRSPPRSRCCGRRGAAAGRARPAGRDRRRAAYGLSERLAARRLRPGDAAVGRRPARVAADLLERDGRAGRDRARARRRDPLTRSRSPTAPVLGLALLSHVLARRHWRHRGGPRAPAGARPHPRAGPAARNRLRRGGAGRRRRARVRRWPRAARDRRRAAPPPRRRSAARGTRRRSAPCARVRSRRWGSRSSPPRSR